MRGEEMVPQPTGNQGNRPLRLSQHLHEVETYLQNRFIWTDWCLSWIHSLLQFCRHLSTLYFWNKRARLILSAFVQWRTRLHIHPQPKISGSVVQVTCTAWIWITWIGADILSRLWHLSLTRSEPDLSKMLLFSQLLVNYPSDALHDVGWPICIADLVKCVPFPLWALFEQLVFRAIALCLQSHYVLLEIAYWAIEGSESY